MQLVFFVLRFADFAVVDSVTGGGPAPKKEMRDQVYSLSGNLGSGVRSTGIVVDSLEDRVDDEQSSREEKANCWVERAVKTVAAFVRSGWLTA